MEFSYKEKSLIASLIVTLYIYGDYFYSIFSELFTSPVQIQNIGNIYVPIILTIILEAIIQSSLALSTRSNELMDGDERDRIIEINSYRSSYWVLVIGVWFLIFQFAIVSSGDWMGQDHTVIFSSPNYLAHLLLLIFIISEVVGYLSRLTAYRRGF